MAMAVIMPRQGQSVESCIIGKWHKQKGDAVAIGDVLFTYETDKATFDETAKESGVLLDVFFAEGDDVPCLTNVCVIGQPGEDSTSFNPNGTPAAAPTATTGPDTSAVPTATTATAAPAADQSAAVTVSAAAAGLSTAPAGQTTVAPVAEWAGTISPRARNLAERSQADLRFAQASGPKDRVIEQDVRRLIAEGRLATAAAGTSYPADIVGTGLGGRVTVADLATVPGTTAQAAVTPAAPAVSTVSDAAVPTSAALYSNSAVLLAAAQAAGPESHAEKHPNIRKVIARTMQASLSQMAQLTLNSSFDAGDMLALRARLKKAGESGLKAEQGFVLAEQVPTLNDIILYAVSRVLSRHPSCNAHYDEEKTTYFNRVHLGVAVDTPRGLMVPTVFNADLLTLGQLSIAVKDRIGSCQKGTISPDDLQGGTITVTNLGILGIESFTPVINPPQTCILGVNNITTRVREVNGQLTGYPAMGLSLTFDHRALDGAPAARFLQDLVKVLENFSLLLMQ